MLHVKFLKEKLFSLFFLLFQQIYKTIFSSGVVFI